MPRIVISRWTDPGVAANVALPVSGASKSTAPSSAVAFKTTDPTRWLRAGARLGSHATVTSVKPSAPRAVPIHERINELTCCGLTGIALARMTAEAEGRRRSAFADQ